MADSASATATVSCTIVIAGALAPNILGVTKDGVTAGINLGYVVIANVPYFQFSGYMTMPVSDPNYSHLAAIQVEGQLDGAGNWIALTPALVPRPGGWVNPQPFTLDRIAQDTNSHTWNIRFRCENESGVFTSSPFTLSSVSVTPGVIQNLTATDLPNQRVLQVGRNVAAAVIQISITLDQDRGKEPVSVWFNPPDYPGWQYVGVYQIGGSGATSTFNASGPDAPAASETWQVAVILGDTGALQTPPANATSVSISVAGYPTQASANDITGASLSLPIYSQDAQGHWDWSVQYSIPIPASLKSSDTSFWTARLAVEKGYVDGQGNWHTYTAAQPNGQPPGTGTIDTDATLGGTLVNTWTTQIPAGGDPNPSYRFHVDVLSNYYRQSAPANQVWTVQTNAWSAATVAQFPGSTSTYLIVTPQPQATGKPLATDITNVTLTVTNQSTDANGNQTFWLAWNFTASADPNGFWILPVVQPISAAWHNGSNPGPETDGNQPYNLSPAANGGCGYGVNLAAPPGNLGGFGYYANAWLRVWIYVLNANGGTVQNPWINSGIATLQANAFGAGVSYYDISLNPPAGAIPANRLAPGTLSSEFSVGSVLSMAQIDLTKSINASAEFHIDPVSGKWSMASIDMSKAANLSSQFALVGNVQTITNLSASTMITGQLQVGGGGNKVSQVRLFDLSSNLGFWGDDSANSGYVGFWAKRGGFGGSGPTTPNFFADANGNVVAASLYIGDASGGYGIINATGSWFKTLGVGGSNYARQKYSDWPVIIFEMPFDAGQVRKCLRCGYRWLSRGRIPLRCAGCGTPYWNVPPGRLKRGRPRKKKA